MRILIVAWNWPPIGRIGAMRALGMAREWTLLGHDVHVVTGPGDRGGEYCPDLLPRAEAARVTVHRAPAPAIPRPARLTPAYTGKGPAMTHPISRIRQVLGQWRGFPDLQRSWIRPAAALAAALHQEQPFGVVWSTSPPESVHFVGRGLAARGVPWVADFRDQWSEYLLARWDPLSRVAVDLITRWTLHRAGAVMANTQGVADSIARASGRQVRCVRNGWDPVPPNNEPVEPRTLGYFGRVDPLMQHPERLWPALRELRAQGRPWRVLFFLTGGGGGGATVRVPEDLRSDVQVLPPLPHPAALARMRSMAALLVLGWEVWSGSTAVGGKLYEYVGSGRPVLACAPSHYEVRRLVEGTRTGVGAWEEAELIWALRQLEAFEVDPRSREPLSRAQAAREALDVLSEAAGRTSSVV